MPKTQVLWHDRRLYGCGLCGRKTKKVIYSMEGENVVAYGRLPSPARCRWTRQNISFLPPPLYHNTTIQLPPFPLSVQTNVCPCRYSIVFHVLGRVGSVGGLGEGPRSIKYNGEKIDPARPTKWFIHALQTVLHL